MQLNYIIYIYLPVISFIFKASEINVGDNSSNQIHLIIFSLPDIFNN